MKYMLIMRATDEAKQAAEGMDFEELINAVGASNGSMMEGATWPAYGRWRGPDRST